MKTRDFGSLDTVLLFGKLTLNMKTLNGAQYKDINVGSGRKVKIIEGPQNL